MLKHILLGAAAIALFTTNALADVKIRNGSEFEITAVYFSPASMKNWGDDHLGKKTLEPGSGLTLSGVEPGSWEARIEFNRPGKDKEYVCEFPVELESGKDDSTFDNKTLKDCAKATEVAHKDDDSGEGESE